MLNLPPKVFENKVKMQLGAHIQYMLSMPFAISSLKKRVMNKSRDGKSANVAYYIDLRDMAERLDLVVGPSQWSLNVKLIDLGDRIGAVSELFIYDQFRTGESEESKESEKWANGAKSMSYNDLAVLRAGPNATKRAAALFGIGSYLYQFKDENTWEPLKEGTSFLANPNIDVSKLPSWAVPINPKLLLFQMAGRCLKDPIYIQNKGVDDNTKKEILSFIKETLNIDTTHLSTLNDNDLYELAAHFARRLDFQNV